MTKIRELERQIQAIDSRIHLVDMIDMADMGASRFDPNYDPDGEFQRNNFDKKMKLQGMRSRLVEELNQAKNTVNG